MSSASNSPYTSPKDNQDSNPFSLDDLLNRYKTTSDDETLETSNKDGNNDQDINGEETILEQGDIVNDHNEDENNEIYNGGEQDSKLVNDDDRSSSRGTHDSPKVVIPKNTDLSPQNEIDGVAGDENTDDKNYKRPDESRSRHDSNELVNESIDENIDDPNSTSDPDDLPSFTKISKPLEGQFKTGNDNNDNIYNNYDMKNNFSYLPKTKMSFDGNDEDNTNYQYDIPDSYSEQRINVTSNCQVFETSPINIFDSDINNFYYKRQYKPKDLIVFPKSPPKPKTIQTESRKPLLSNIQSFDDLFNFYEPELRQLFIFYGYNHRGNIKKDTMDKTINFAEVIKCIKDLHIYSPCTQLNKAAVQRIFICVANPNNKQELTFQQFGHLFVRLCGISICRPPFTNRFRNPYDLCCIILYLLELDNKKYLKSRLRGFDEFTKGKVENIDDCLMYKRINLMEYNSVLPTNQWIDVQSLFGNFSSPIPEIPLLKSKEPVFIPQLFLIPVNIISQSYTDTNIYNAQNPVLQLPGAATNMIAMNMNHNITFAGQSNQHNTNYQPIVVQNIPPVQNQFPNTFARQGNQIANTSFIPANIQTINPQNNKVLSQGHNIVAPPLQHNLPQTNMFPGPNININNNNNPYGLPPNQPTLPPYNPLAISNQPNYPRPPPRFHNDVTSNPSTIIPQYVGTNPAQNYGSMANNNKMNQNQQQYTNQYLPPTNKQNISNNLIPTHLNRNVLKDQPQNSKLPQKKYS